MIFDLIPNLISAIISILLPLYFTYKSIRTSSLPLLTSWLYYWPTLSLLFLFESYLPLLSWLPLYSTIRLCFLLYLVLPQTQGARYIWTAHIEPFLRDNEQKIDHLIADTHDKLKAGGLGFMEGAIEWIKTHILQIQSQAPQPQRPEPKTAESYVSSLLARFSMPAPLPSATAASSHPASDFYTLLSSAASTIGLSPSPPSANTQDQIASLLSSGALVPPHLKTTTERANFVSAQREKLGVLLGALDKEARQLEVQRDVEKRVDTRPGGLTKTRSEPDFERVEKEEAVKEARGVEKAGGGWLGWLGGGSKDTEGEGQTAEGRSSGAEI